MEDGKNKLAESCLSQTEFGSIEKLLHHRHNIFEPKAGTPGVRSRSYAAPFSGRAADRILSPISRAAPKILGRGDWTRLTTFCNEKSRSLLAEVVLLVHYLSGPSHTLTPALMQQPINKLLHTAQLLECLFQSTLFRLLLRPRRFLRLKLVRCRRCSLLSCWVHRRSIRCS